MHVWAKKRKPGQQTIEQVIVAMDNAEVVTAESVGMCAPGEALIRHFFREAHKASNDYKLSWRQQNVPMTVGAVDATFKRGKDMALSKVRQTVCSNDVNAPAIAVFVPSASMDDPGFTAACDDYNKVRPHRHLHVHVHVH